MWHSWCLIFQSAGSEGGWYFGKTIRSVLMLYDTFVFALLKWTLHQSKEVQFRVLWRAWWYRFMLALRSLVWPSLSRLPALQICYHFLFLSLLFLSAVVDQVGLLFPLQRLFFFSFCPQEQEYLGFLQLPCQLSLNLCFPWAYTYMCSCGYTFVHVYVGWGGLWSFLIW